PRRRSAHAAGLSMLPGLHFPVSVALESMGTGPFLPFGPDLAADPAPAAGPLGGAGVPAVLLPVGFGPAAVRNRHFSVQPLNKLWASRLPGGNAVFAREPKQ